MSGPALKLSVFAVLMRDEIDSCNVCAIDLLSRQVLQVEL